MAYFDDDVENEIARRTGADLAEAQTEAARQRRNASLGEGFGQIVASIAGAPQTFDPSGFRAMGTNADNVVKDVIAQRTAAKEDAAASRQSKLDEITFQKGDRESQDYERKHDATRPELGAQKSLFKKLGAKFGYTPEQVDAMNAEDLEGLRKSVNDQLDAETAIRLGGMRVNAPPKPHALTAGQSETLSGHDSAIKQLDGVEAGIDNYAPMMGPVEGRARGANPYDTEAQAFDAQLKLVAQNVGKALEGGKLAEGDIARYRKMLPNLSDTPAVAKRKVQALRELVRQKQQSDIETAKKARFDVSGFEGTATPPPKQKGRVMVTVSNGKETLRVPADRLTEAEKDGFKVVQ